MRLELMRVKQKKEAPNERALGAAKRVCCGHGGVRAEANGAP